MMFKGGICGFTATLGVAIWWPSTAVLIPFATIFLNVIKNFVDLRRQSAKDFDEARTPFGTISAFFGWTHARKVGSGDRPLNFGFTEGALFGSILGFITALAVHDMMSKGDAL